MYELTKSHDTAGTDRCAMGSPPEYSSNTYDTVPCAIPIDPHTEESSVVRAAVPPVDRATVAVSTGIHSENPEFGGLCVVLEYGGAARRRREPEDALRGRAVVRLEALWVARSPCRHARRSPRWKSWSTLTRPTPVDASVADCPPMAASAMRRVE